MADAQILKAEEIDFSASTQVISSAQKFVIPVPAFMSEGEPLVYPAGAEKAGEQITDWQGKPIGDSGIVFFNGKDKAYQAAVGDGQAVIIINGVSEEQAAKIVAKINESSVDPNGLTVSELKAVLDFVQADLGVVDMYNSDRKFIAGKMNALATSSTGVEAYGLHKRDDRDICFAVRLNGSGQFQGPAATPQQYEGGAVILKQGDSVRLIQSDIFEQTYRLASGKPLTVGDVAEAKTVSASSSAAPKPEQPKK
jgi:hypothetical protein